MNVTVIPQSPPIKVRMRRYEGDTAKPVQTRKGRIVAWQVHTDDSSGEVFEMHPVIWPTDESTAFTFGAGEDYVWEVRPDDEWDL